LLVGVEQDMLVQVVAEEVLEQDHHLHFLLEPIQSLSAAVGMLELLHQDKVVMEPHQYFLQSLLLVVEVVVLMILEVQVSLQVAQVDPVEVAVLLVVIVLHQLLQEQAEQETLHQHLHHKEIPAVMELLHITVGLAAEVEQGLQVLLSPQ